MIKGVVKGRSLTIIGTDGDVFTSGSVGLKIKVTFDDEWNGLVKQAVFQNGSNAYISTAINDEFEVPLEVLSIPGRVLRIGIRGTNGTTLVIPTIYAECRIYEGSDKDGAAGQEWSPSEVDQVLSAVAAIDNKVGDLDDLLTTAKDSVVSAINEVFGRPIPTGVSDDLKEALLQLAQKVAYIDEHGQNYYDDLYYALYPGNLISITATYDTTHKALVGDTLDSLKPYLTVIAFYDDNTSREVTNYILSGSLSNAGNNTIGVYFIDHLTSTTTSFVVSTVFVSSISAVFTQGQATIYTNDSLDTLRQYLVVTANYSDSSTQILNDDAYDLSGALSEGTQTITASYGDKSDTFTVVCTVKGWLYHFSQNLLSSGSEDFNLTGASAQYAERVSGNYAYFRPIDTVVDPSTTVGLAIKAINLNKVPDMSNDWTISGWAKGSNSGFNLMTAYKAPSSSTTNVPTANSGVDNLASGWAVGENTAVGIAYKGVRVQSVSGLINIQLFASDENKRVWIKLQPPSSFDYGVWHHYALTRKNGVIRFFVDGAIICSVNYNHPIYFADQVSITGAFKGYADPNNTILSSWDSYADDVFIAEYCKWDSPFDATQILY